GAAPGGREEDLPDRHPDPLGLRRPQDRPALARERADAVRRRRQRALPGVQGLPRQHREDVMAMAAPDAGRALSPWAAHRQRAEARRGRRPVGAGVRTVYRPLLDVWGDGGDAARVARPEPRQLARWAAERTAPRVVKAAQAAGPEPLAAAARDLATAGRIEEPLA